MPTNNNNAELGAEIQIALDRMTLVHLQGIAEAVLNRMEAIKAKYPAGTFDDGEVVEIAGELPEVETVLVTPKRGRKLGAKNKPKLTGLGLTDALRAYAKHKGIFTTMAFKEDHPQFKPDSVSGILAGLAASGKLKRIGVGEYQATDFT